MNDLTKMNLKALYWIAGGEGVEPDPDEGPPGPIPEDFMP